MATTAKKAATVKVAPAKTAPTKTGSNVAVLKKTSGALVDLKAQLAAQAAALNERIAPASGITIRATQDKHFILPTGEKVSEIELVVVEFVSRNDFYEGAYVQGQVSPPACFAIGTNPQKLIPSANSPQPQSETCAECPMNAFGSSGAGKACKNGRILGVLPPDADADDALWMLKVSPTALKSFDAFVRNVVNTMGMPPVGAVCKVSFDPNVTYASMVFEAVSANENLEVHASRQAEARALISEEPDVSQYETAAAQSKAKAKAVPRRR